MSKEKIPYIPEDPDSCERWTARNDYEKLNPRWKYMKDGQSASIVQHITKHIGLKKE